MVWWWHHVPKGCPGTGIPTCLGNYTLRRLLCPAILEWRTPIIESIFVFYQQAILNGSNPKQILQVADAPLWTPMNEPWMAGSAPYTCNVPQVTVLRDMASCQVYGLYKLTNVLTMFGTANLLMKVAFLEAATTMENQNPNTDLFRVTQCQPML